MNEFYEGPGRGGIGRRPAHPRRSPRNVRFGLPAWRLTDERPRVVTCQAAWVVWRCAHAVALVVTGAVSASAGGVKA